jgi:Trypsin/Divergent InlB B-repeat domain
MRRSSIIRALSGTGIALAALLTVMKAEAISNGITTSDLAKTVMFVHKYSSTGSDLGVGTAANIFASRCFLSAGHVGENAHPDNSWVYSGQTYSPFFGGKRQKLETIRVLSASEVYQDVAVFWAQNSTTPNDDQGRPRLQEPADYTKVDYGGNLPGTTTGVTIFGYGNNTPQGGSGTRRRGIAKYLNYKKGTEVIPALDGARYILGVGPTGQLGCSGDSGGPLFAMGDYSKTYGVLSMGGNLLGQDCSGSATGALGNFYTAIDSAKRNVAGAQSNKEWVDKQTTDICGKKMSFFFGAPSGYLTGTLEDYRYVYSDNLSINGAIDCDPTVDAEDPPGTGMDCDEMVHEGETLEFTATPDSGWHFAEWMDADPETNTNCPCVGQGATCTVEYEDMGYYDDDESIDDSLCMVVFEED